MTQASEAVDYFRARVAEATAARKPLRIRGGGTKDWYGQELAGDVLETGGYRGVIAYDPAELVITACAGTPLSEIEATLAAHDQMLPFEPPHFGANATLGGCIAAGLSGPRRAYAGAPRDFVLGAVIMNGRGDVLHFGGQVMKNVAGYDVARLMAGSLGTLGLILEVSIKVLPRPVAETTLMFTMNATDAVRKLNEWAGSPLPVAASAWRDGTLAVRLAGSDAGVKAACGALSGETVDPVEATRFWENLREQKDSFFTSAPPGHALWRLALPSTAEPVRMPGGTQLVEWGGAQRWIFTDADAKVVRACAEEAQGHATLFRHGDKAVGVFTPLAPALMKIHRGLKAAFDPAGIFNPRRMYNDF